MTLMNQQVLMSSSFMRSAGFTLNSPCLRGVTMKLKCLKTRVVEVQLTLPIDDSTNNEKGLFSCKISNMSIILYQKSIREEQSERERIYKELAESAKKLLW